MEVVHSKMTIDAERINKIEEKRIDDLYEYLAREHAESVPIDQIFDSKEIPKILHEEPLGFWSSFREANIILPLNCLLFPRTLVQICSLCDCNKNPESIRPYLERGLILPILTQRASNYDPAFLEMVTQHPYIGFHTHWFLRNISYRSNINFENLDKRFKRISKSLTQNAYCKSLFEKAIIGHLAPAQDPQIKILNEIENAIKQRNPQLLEPFAHKAVFIDTMRTSGLFQATPNVRWKDLHDSIQASKRLGIPIDSEVIEEIQRKEWVAKTLDLDYNPTISIETYLDIIIPRRRKINKLIKELMTAKENENQLSRINDEIWKINQEISSSKAMESITFLTSFTHDNAKILLSMLVGALLGYSTGSFLGCGVGSIGGFIGGTAGDWVAKRKSFKIPKYPQKTIEWMKAKMEGPEEKVLSIMLSKDIKTIQIWSLQKKLKK